MKKPLLVLKKQKNTAKILLAIVLLLIGAFIIYENNREESGYIQVFGEQGQSTGSRNKTVADLLGRIMEG